MVSMFTPASWASWPMVSTSTGWSLRAVVRYRVKSGSAVVGRWDHGGDEPATGGQWRADDGRAEPVVRLGQRISPLLHRGLRHLVHNVGRGCRGRPPVVVGSPPA